MFLKKSTPKYKHLYAKPGKMGWLHQSSIITKLMLVLIFILIVAVAWLGGATAKWKVQKKKYRERISVLRMENEALRVEKDLMITRMTIAGLLRPVKDGVYEFDGEDLTYYNGNEPEEDVGYSEIVSFTNFGGSYNAKNGQVKITFKINNIIEGEDKIEGRVFVVLGGDDMPVDDLKLLPDDSTLSKDGRPDGTKGGASFAMREFKDMAFNTVIDAKDAEKYTDGMIFVFTKEGELVQIWPLEINLAKASGIIITEVE